MTVMRAKSGTVSRDFRVSELLAMIDSGELVLPEFQRDFDWGDERVSQLLATVARRWPAGSLLLQEYTGSAFYTLREFAGGPALDPGLVVYTVMDGQQRLTALYHAVYDTGDVVYAVRARALGPNATIEALEDGIEAFGRTHWDAERREAPWDPEEDWIPFYALRSPTDFFSWRDVVIRRAGDHIDTDSAAAALSDAYRFGLESFNTYIIPAVIVEQNLEPEAVARIFERVNRTGLNLSAFDLMVAKTFETGWNLRDKWDLARSSHPVLDDFFGDDGMPVIRAISLKATDSVREGDVLRLPGQAVRTDWDSATTATSQALSFLRQRCGVHRPEWLPYGGMLSTLTGIAFEHDLNEVSAIIESWFWSRAYSLRFEGGQNTTTVDEYHHLQSVIRGDVGLRSESLSRELLLEATRKRRSAIWRTFMCTLASLSPRDPISGDEIDLLEAVPMHLFERESNLPPGTESRHLLVLNLILASKSTNRRLSGRGIEEFEATLEESDSYVDAEIRQTQLLPGHGIGADRFVEARVQLLVDHVMERAGSGLQLATP